MSELVEPATRIDVAIGAARRPYRIWLGNGEILAIDCPVHFPTHGKSLQPVIVDPTLIRCWRTFWRADRRPPGRIARAVMSEAEKIFTRRLKK